MNTIGGSSTSVRPTWFEIDLGAVTHNYRELRRHLGDTVAMYACLKRNAYGCGTVAVARALSAAGCTGFAFGNIDDGIAARAGGIDEPILLYPNCLPEQADIVARERLTISIASVAEAMLWNARFDRPQPVFIKVDAGAFRAGTLPRDAASLIEAVRRLPKLRLRGIYGHVHLGHVADTAGYALWQIENFRRVLEVASASGATLEVSMLSSSATLLDHAAADFTGVDPGRLLFGLHEGPSRRPVDLKPALVGFKTRLVGQRTLADVDLGGFPTPFPFRQGMRIGLLPVGWGDGLPRQLPEGAAALIRGKRVALLGPVHLEQTRIDLSTVDDTAIGDEVVLFGTQDGQALPFTDVVTQWGSSPADFHGSMAGHVDRRYLG